MFLIPRRKSIPWTWVFHNPTRASSTTRPSRPIKSAGARIWFVSFSTTIKTHNSLIVRWHEGSVGFFHRLRFFYSWKEGTTFKCHVNTYLISVITLLKLVRWLPQRTLVPSFFFLLSSAFFILGLFMYDFMWFIKFRPWAGMYGMCAGVHGCARVCTGVRCAGVHECERVCMAVCAGVHGCVRRCLWVCVEWIFRIPTGDLSPNISGL